ncbi:MAG: HNH endonuclease [Lentimicrobiaceae bacterium]|jgi:putative restriction endonuclease
MQDHLLKYMLAFRKLHIDRSHGIAPHKPILLLSVLQAYQNNLITSQRIYITPEIVALFKTNWSLLVTTQHDCRISYPFYYLKSEKFWKLIPKPGFENIDQMGSIMKSFSNLNAAVDFAVINDDLCFLMQDKSCNSILQQFLLDEYFPLTKADFSNSIAGQLRLFNEIEDKIISEKPYEYQREIKNLMLQQNEEEIFLRGSIFKREIPKIYNYTCCISGMKIAATISVSMIDACHIVPFSECYDDTISNGISLCPNLHRAFDRGLISIDDNYKVLVKSNWSEDQSNYSIKQFEGKQILLPSNSNQFPSLENFNLHRVRFSF